MVTIYTEKEYEYASGVNIHQLNPATDKRDKGYLGEYLVFEDLYKNFKFPAKFFMNLEIPINDKTTEIDMLMVCQYGIVAFEIKYFTGKVFGNSEDRLWTEYFRTRKNESFLNPFLQNDYHLSALKKIFPEIPIFSAVIMANPQAQCQITSTRKDVFFSGIYKLSSNLSLFLSNKASVVSQNDIENLFEKLIPYSKIKDKVNFQNETMPFNLFVNRLKQEETDLIKKTKKSKRKFALLSTFLYLCIVLAVVLFSFLTVMKYKAEAIKYQSETDNAIKEVQQIKEYITENDYRNHGNLSFLNGTIYSANVTLKESSFIKNTVIFGCDIINGSSEYSFAFPKTAEVIVGFSEGQVETYPLPINPSTVGHYANPGQKTKIDPFEIYNVTADRKIQYIKISQMAIYKGYYSGSHTLLADQLTITVYPN